MAPYFKCMKLVSSSWLCPRTILDQTTTVTLGAPRVNNNDGQGFTHRKQPGIVKQKTTMSVNILKRKFDHHLMAIMMWSITSSTLTH